MGWAIKKDDEMDIIENGVMIAPPGYGQRVCTEWNDLGDFWCVAGLAWVFGIMVGLGSLMLIYWDNAGFGYTTSPYPGGWWEFVYTLKLMYLEGTCNYKFCEGLCVWFLTIWTIWFTTFAAHLTIRHCSAFNRFTDYLKGKGIKQEDIIRVEPPVTMNLMAGIVYYAFWGFFFIAGLIMTLIGNNSGSGIPGDYRGAMVGVGILAMIISGIIMDRESKDRKKYKEYQNNGTLDCIEKYSEENKGKHSVWCVSGIDNKKEFVCSKSDPRDITYFQDKEIEDLAKKEFEERKKTSIDGQFEII